MPNNSPTTIFPYSYPEYLSTVLHVLSDGADHAKAQIRERVLSRFPLTPEQLSLKHLSTNNQGVFVNKVAHAFSRLVIHKAIIEVEPDSYRITHQGLEALKRRPEGLRERDLR